RYVQDYGGGGFQGRLDTILDELRALGSALRPLDAAERRALTRSGLTQSFHRRILMSFLPAVHREIANRPPQDPVRVTLEYMLRHAVGRANAIPLAKIVSSLGAVGIRMTETGFQQTVLAESRG